VSQLGGAVSNAPATANGTVNDTVNDADGVLGGGLSSSGVSQAVQGASDTLLGPNSAVGQATGSNSAVGQVADTADTTLDGLAGSRSGGGALPDLGVGG
jgi:hypothetical protein